MFPTTRMRRLRSSKFRPLVRETTLDVKDLICPIFVDETISEPLEINSMPGVFRQSLKTVANDAAGISQLRIPSIIIFLIPAQKDYSVTHAYVYDDVVQTAVWAIKNKL